MSTSKVKHAVFDEDRGILNHVQTLLKHRFVCRQVNFQETDNGKQRFLLELEFVQLLANPAYINREFLGVHRS